MGELSKKIGEAGEAMVLEFFRRIGWPAPVENTDIKCLSPAKHRERESATHGIDLIYSYICPVQPGFRRNILVSVKNSQDHETKTVRRKVVADFEDLADALVCFKPSPLRQRMVKGGGARHIEEVGILFKLNKDPDSSKSVLGANRNVEFSGNPMLAFVENVRIDFIERCLHHANHHFSGWKVTFFHPRNPLTAPADARQTSSGLLPWQSVVAGPLAVKLEEKGDDGKAVLAIYSQQPFNVERFQRLVGIAMELSASWVKARIVFPDYEDTRDGTTVRAVLSGLADASFSNKVNCMTLELLSRLA